MDRLSRLATAVVNQSWADISTSEVKPLLRRVIDADLDEETLVDKVALAFDLEYGAIQREYEEYVVAHGGIIVEDEDGVIYGFDKDGNEI